MAQEASQKRTDVLQQLQQGLQDLFDSDKFKQSAVAAHTMKYDYCAFGRRVSVMIYV